MNQTKEQLLTALTRKNLPSSIDYAGIRFQEERITTRSFRDGKPEAQDQNTSSGVMVEVLVDGQFGYASTPRLDSESLKQALETAKVQAAQAAKYAAFRFDQTVRPAVTGEYATPVGRPLSSMSGLELNQWLEKVCETLKRSPKIIRTEAFAETTEYESRLLSTEGSDAHSVISIVSSDFRATAQEGSIVQKRSGGGFRGCSLQGGWDRVFTADLMERVALCGEQALELLAAPECPTGVMDLVLTPDQMMLQIHESIGHPLEMDRILGDERNYAGWSFVNLSDFGTLVYGSPLMNVTFDPTVTDELASYAFDDIGNPAKREYLIKDGLLVKGLGSLESQKRAGAPGVANQRACSWNRPPIDRMANINLEAGTSSRDELIGSVKNGVLMESNRSWSIDDFRNKFQFGCEYGRLIENGKVGRVVKNPNYRGVTVPFWKKLKKVGDASTMGTFGTPNCGKGEPNQVIRVGHRSPLCLFEAVEVFGGES